MLNTFLFSWRKLTVFLIASALILFKEQLDLGPAQVDALATVAGGFLVGQGIADFSKGSKTSINK